MLTALTNARVMTPEGLKDECTVVIDQGRIVDVGAALVLETAGTTVQDIEGALLLPGFIDLQVNGGGGVLFNNDPSVAGIKEIGRAHRAFGTTGFLPTLISDDLELMAEAIAAVDAAISEQVPGVLGIHLEGPFLNADRKGVHDASKFKTIGDDEIDLLSSLKHGKTLVTLAPEMTTLDTIKCLRDRGVVIAAGHTEADYNDALEAMDAGLKGFTHLFNAMAPLQSRKPGIISAALEDARAWCGIIVDGYHVHPAMLRLAIRAKTEDQISLVTDAMPCVGTTDRRFSLGEMDISVTDGKCVTQSGVLAGSNLNMMRAVINAADWLDVTFDRAVRMASAVPARFLGLGEQMGEIKAGRQANLILVDDSYKIVDSWINGCLTSFSDVETP
ncbi:N-acetylglucosamine-6-phosphate deacetylase [uncultured Algimonas sp.]|uniref:N-acetylglucosamine-6-phosphate deacetylase n=1 Tax=uncultured Algimonas sp. TaxID=1547920 RepID=UPI00261B9245|nr:N-acetylglucosamine-6-phosphate deacetylase [uncultured Algimonas sp.]